MKRLKMPLALWAIIGLVAGGLMLFSGDTAALADKPSDPSHDVVRMSNGYPSGQHFNFNVHGKNENFLCPEPPYGASAFIPEYGESTIEFVASKKYDVDRLTVLDACASAFPVFGDTDEIDGTPPDDHDPVRVQLPKTGIYSEGFWVFARVLAKQKNKDGEDSSIILTPDPNIRVCNDGEHDLDGDGTLDDCPSPDSDLMALGLLTQNGVFTADGQELERPKGKVKATDITSLFTWSGHVCPDTLDTDGDGDIDEDDVLVDLDGDGVIGDADDLAILLALECEFHDSEWVFNVADLVVEDVNLNNNGAKLLKVRLYPVATTSFTPTTPTVNIKIHDEYGDTVITGGTAPVDTSVHASAVLTAGTGPAPIGSVDFTFYGDGTCAGAAIPAGSVGLADGVAHPSDSQLMLAAGVYSFRAVYDGADEFYEGASSSCATLVIGDEATVATQIHDSSDHGTDLAGGPVVEGTSVHAQAIVTGSGGDIPTGHVTFMRYATSDCSGASVDQVLALAGGTAESADFATVAGSLAYLVHYHGDDPVHFPADGICTSLTVDAP